MIWGIPFVVIGLYMIAGRFFWDAYIRSKQLYAVTSQRLIVISSGSVNSSSLLSLPQLILTASAAGQGTIDFGPSYYSEGDNGNRGRGIWTPGSSGTRFVFLDEAQHVFQIIQKAQKQAQAS